MKICIVAEGCYPYVVGGVSGWIHSMIKSFSNIEFCVLAIVANRSQRGNFAYDLPENLTEVYEVYLDDYDWSGRSSKYGKRTKLNTKQFNALRSIIIDKEVDWNTLFDLFQKEKISIDDLLMGADFLQVVKEAYNMQYSQMIFSDFLWTVRSIYLPLFLVLKSAIPKADIYHCVATGYAGVLGSMAKHIYGCGLMVSEHGIYTREREEELLRASWVSGVYKNIWIDQFRKMSRLAYHMSDVVTSLYEHAKGLQIELGCPKDKIVITPNGIDMERLSNLQGKKAEEADVINIGAILRVTPIKDVKTLIRAYAYAREEKENLRLWIMGPWEEDKEYAEECFELVEQQRIPGITFTGRVDIREYLGRMDFTMLTSISEGQPLTVLESFAARKPVIATDVGNCRELIYGNNDGYQAAGILTHIMNVSEIARAMIELASSPSMREDMGNNGYERVKQRYQLHQMKETYAKIYEELGWEHGREWPTEVFTIKK